MHHVERARVNSIVHLRHCWFYVVQICCLICVTLNLLFTATFNSPKYVVLKRRSFAAVLLRSRSRPVCFTQVFEIFEVLEKPSYQTGVSWLYAKGSFLGGRRGEGWERKREKGGGKVERGMVAGRRVLFALFIRPTSIAVFIIGRTRSRQPWLHIVILVNPPEMTGLECPRATNTAKREERSERASYTPGWYFRSYLRSLCWDLLDSCLHYRYNDPMTIAISRIEILLFLVRVWVNVSLRTVASFANLFANNA